MNGLLMRIGESIVGPLGQSSARWQILGRVGASPQTVAQMARDMGLARQSIQRVADVLARDGLVIYKDLPTDRRTQLLQLTPSGEEVLAAIYQRNQEWSKRVVGLIDPERWNRITEELIQLGSILETDGQRSSEESAMVETTFTATIRKDEGKGGWTYVVWPDSAQFLGTKKAFKVAGTIDGQEFSATFLPTGDGSHLLPLRASLVKVLGKKGGDAVEIRLKE